ncbi:hypothetical protein [Hyalangium versicolor]|uniref:hypothetical protein n=1 Tax=Hyalangium versicolor TaxID=2861190 RepID=UPI001CCBCDBD|nr:hypothetical protein [Hyalangium versicolor]
MKHVLVLLLCSLLPGCALFRRPPRPVHAPPEEAAQVQFPLGLPEQERQIIRGNILRAVQLAMDDFLPWDTRPHEGASPLELCLYRREAYDAITAPGPEGIIFVSIVPSPHECDFGSAPVLDLGATYAIDVRGWRILAIQGQ